jgi:type III secretory pathway component EscR
MPAAELVIALPAVQLRQGVTYAFKYGRLHQLNIVIICSVVSIILQNMAMIFMAAAHR